MKVSLITTIMKRELQAYFITPVAYVFLVVFLSLISALTFYFGYFFERGQADLQPFFMFHPWLFMLFIPALTMRLWAEERKTGTLETILSLPVPSWYFIIGKFLAAWLFMLLMLSLTTPLWLTTSYLGDPDHGAIISAYIGSGLLSASFISIGLFFSSLTHNQIIAFIISVTAAFLLTMMGSPMVLNIFATWLPELLYQFIRHLSLLTHFTDMSRGVIYLTSFIYFVLLTSLFLWLTYMSIECKKG